MDFADAATPVGLSEKEIKRIEKLVLNSAETALAFELKDFEASMNRRYWRDVRNLNESYKALRQEMKKFETVRFVQASN